VADHDRDLGDFLAVTARLRAVLEGALGKLRVSDALALAGFARPSFHRKRIVARAMRELGWNRERRRFDGALLYTYSRGSVLEREVILDVVHGDDGSVSVKRREP